MTKETRTVWIGKDGHELLIKQSQDSWYIPLGTIDKAALIELGAAVISALEEIKPQPKHATPGS